MSQCDLYLTTWVIKNSSTYIGGLGRKHTSWWKFDLNSAVKKTPLSLTRPASPPATKEIEILTWQTIEGTTASHRNLDIHLRFLYFHSGHTTTRTAWVSGAWIGFHCVLHCIGRQVVGSSLQWQNEWLLTGTLSDCLSEYISKLKTDSDNHADKSRIVMFWMKVCTIFSNYDQQNHNWRIWLAIDYW